MSATKQHDNKPPRGNAKTKPISLYPEQIKFVDKRANIVGGVSKYFQLLADYDRKHNILPAALKQLAEELEGSNANE